MGKTVNEITIQAAFDIVFDLSNNIKEWPNLFKEYESTKILEERHNYIKFCLTKKEGGVSWISERYLDKENKVIHAHRLDPVFPFKFMSLKWDYEPDGDQTKMTWIQEFQVDPASCHTEKEMEDHLNAATKEEMKRMKEAIEAWQQ